MKTTIAPLLLLVAASVGCGDVLGIEERSYDPTSCVTGADCRESTGHGFFCNAGTCEPVPPNNDACEMFEPEETADLRSFDWQDGVHIVLGVLQRLANGSEIPRLESMRLAVREINDTGGLSQ